MPGPNDPLRDDKSHDSVSDVNRGSDGVENSNLAAISRKLESLQASITSLGERMDRLTDGRKVLNVDHTLGGLEASVANLDRRTAAHEETIDQLLQWNSTVPTLEKNVDKTMSDLNQLGQKRVAKLEGLVGTAKTVGGITVALTIAGITFLIYLLQFLEKHVVFKP
jgi:uncharacterized coiled-coil protein SlyX